MKVNISVDAIYVPSLDIVAREIQGEIIIVPLVSGMADMEDELFTLNKIGRVVWDKLDGKKTLKDLIRELSCEYEAPSDEIEKDVIGLMEELLKRRIVAEAKDL